MPENYDAADLWLTVRRQFIMGPNGPIGINYLAVFAIADKMGIHVDESMIRKIQIIETEEMKQSEKIPEYCQACIAAGTNTDCSDCDLSKVSQ